MALQKPDILVDAAGPFQGSGYDVVNACIATRVHYIDLSDGREFVARIGTLDKAARDAGVTVVSGASSVPALSFAVARKLAEGIDRVSAVEMAISASNRATAGASVIAAMLGYVGKPLRLWRGGRWSIVYGWQGLTREVIALANGTSLGARYVAFADVPDLALMPNRLPGTPAVTFRAGTELPLQNFGMWLLSWPVRWGWFATLLPAAGLLRWLQLQMRSFGSDRSGMVVHLFGTRGATRVERSWRLIALEGDGPEIPALAIPLIVEAIATGRLKSGARDAGGLLTLADFEPAFAQLSIAHEQSETRLPPPLYRQVMGADFDRLPTSVKDMHDILRNGGSAGRARVDRGSNPIARLIGWIMGFPPKGDHDLHVEFSERDGVERWTRNFSGKKFSSRLSQKGHRLAERFGPLSFAFDLPVGPEGLTMIMRAWWFGPIRMPLWLAPRSLAREWDKDGVFQFDVPIAFPFIGLIVHYRGWLKRL